jgi:hypothetical protein
MVAVSCVSMWHAEGFTKVQEIFSPFNLINFLFTLATLSPGIGAYLLADNLAARSPQPAHSPSRDVSARGRDLVSEYAAVLERASTGVLRPESELPAPMHELKEAIVAQALALRSSGALETQHLEALRIAYASLANFVGDRSAAANQQLVETGRRLARGEIDALEAARLIEPLPDQSPVLASSNEQFSRLLREFDSRTSSV